MTPDLPMELRIGCVPYLNARPLVWGIDERVTFEVPSILSDHFRDGRFDVALLPVFEALRMPGVRIVDGVSISGSGPVRSVIVAHRLPLEETPEIVLDPSSRTSSNLLRVLAGGAIATTARLVDSSGDPKAARLLIGDPALEFRRHLPDGWRVTDLSGEWHRWTGLPFVFAVWVVRAGLDADGVARGLRSVACEGLAAREQIAAGCEEPDEARAYLAGSIRYGLGADGRQALERFRAELAVRDLIPPGNPLPEFV